MLANKARPKSLNAVIGQGGALRSLVKYFEINGRYPPVILLHGPTGCGKTTIAEILAQGAGMLRVLNASDHNGVNDMREQVDLMQLPPLVGGLHVLIMNEAQGLTKEAQRCLLDPLERVPEFSQWILTSMEPEKLDKALRDRCFHVGVQPLSVPADVLRLIEPYGGTMEQAETFIRSGITAPRDILRQFEAGTCDGETGIVMFDAVRAYYRGDTALVRQYFQKAKPDEIVTWHYTALVYGRTTMLHSTNTSARQKLQTLLAVGASSDVTLRSTALICAIFNFNPAATT